MEAVKIVTIKDKLPLFTKEGERASNIEVVTFYENDFHVVTQKNLYKIGYKGVYIFPDYCVSEKEIFQDFIAPGGEESKSYLGKVEGKPRRIRAKKFNMSLDKEIFTPVYSNGILLPYDVVERFLKKDKALELLNLTEELGITKWEEPEPKVDKSGNIVRERSFPEGVYKTDETNIKANIKSLKLPTEVYISEKVDGSSITIGITSQRPEGFICSRSIEKPLTVKKVTGRRNKTLLELLMFWKKVDLNLYTEIQNPDDFVKYGLPILNKLKESGINNCILRGELVGKSCKGSGNKYNPFSKEENQVLLFGSDTWNTQFNTAIRDDYSTFQDKVKLLGLKTAKQYGKFDINTVDKLNSICERIFREEKKEGRLIEGVVIRTTSTLDSYSAKYMNDEYDSKK